MTQNIIFIIGPTACGKTELGNNIAKKLNATFIDADDYHSDYNRQKMSSGTPLTDDDRYPWLISVRNAATQCLEKDAQNVVVACSALKQIYRNILSTTNTNTCKEYFFYLQADFNLLRQRLTTRKNHFMPENLIQSQLDTFEFPPSEQLNFYTLKAQESIEDLTSNIISLVK